MTAPGGPAGQGERAFVVGPLAMPGFLLILIGVRRHRRVFVLAGAVLLGLAIKLVDRPRPSTEPAAPAPAPASESEVSAAQEPPTSSEPPTPSKPSAQPRPPKPEKPQAASAPEAPAADSEPAASEPEPDQPETA